MKTIETRAQDKRFPDEKNFNRPQLYLRFFLLLYSLSKFACHKAKLFDCLRNKFKIQKEMYQ